MRDRTRDVLEVGFSAARAHRLIGIDRCPVLAKSLDGALKAAWAAAETLDPVKKPIDIQATATDQGLDVDLRGSGPLTPQLTAALARVAAQQNLARLTRHGELIAQARAPTLRMGAATVVLPPAVFLQATAAGEAALVRLVLDHCASAKTIADLFAGVGPFALRLAERARITAVDEDDAALAALSRAAASTAGLKPVAAERRDLFKNPLVAAELNRFEAIVFDPPRQGAQSTVARNRGQPGAAGCRGVMQCRNFCARYAATDRRRLSAHVRHAGRSVPLLRPCRDRRAAGEMIGVSQIPR